MKQNKIYEISFIAGTINWVSISSIDKNTLDAFIDYLYKLDRDIILDKYIPGGLVGVAVRPYLDKTSIVEKMIREIKSNNNVNLMLSHIHFSFSDNNNPFHFYFVEDLYDYLLSHDIDKETAIEACFDKDKRKELLKDNQEYQDILKWLSTGYWPFSSRWKFIYMFRSEFINFMKERGYTVSIKGGWILNDKNREMKLGLIDIEGNLL